LIFHNVNIKRLILNKPTAANTPVFTLLANGGENLKSSIKELKIYDSQLRVFNSDLLDKFVFRALEKLLLFSELDLFIQSDLFSSLEFLQEFDFRLGDLGGHVKRPQSLDWMKSLNADFYVDLSDSTALTNPANRYKEFKLILGDMSGSYEFPDQDFCLFKNFPHSKWVFPFIYTKPDLECSCTLIWLVKYWRYYSFPYQIQTQSLNKCNFTISSFENSVKECEFEKRVRECNACSYDQDSAFLNCNDMLSLNTLNFSQAQSIKKLRIKPQYKVKFDASLNFQADETKLEDNYEVLLENFDGFELNANPFSDISNRRGSLLDLKNLDLKFCENKICMLESGDGDSKPLFSSFENIYLEASVKFVDEICPVAFRNANIKRLVLNGPVPSNNLNFKSLDSQSLSIDSVVEELEVYNSELYSLNSSFLDEHVFKALKRFVFSALNPDVSIELDLFEPFKFLKEFDFRVFNLREYVMHNSMLWMESLNQGVYVDLSDSSALTDPANKNKEFKLKIGDLSDFYELPDEDFCLFKNFPHSKWVFPVIKAKPGLECSCTLVWLVQYYKYYSFKADLITPSVSKCLSDPNFEQIILDCNFKKRVEDCDGLNSTPASSTDSTSPPEGLNYTSSFVSSGTTETSLNSTISTTTMVITF
jgi:hypothetical protein